MPKFSYKAQNSIGLPVSGSVFAENEMSAKAILGLKGFSKVELRKASFLGFLADLNAKLEKSTSNTTVKPQEVAIVSRQLATLVNAGVNLLEAVSDVAVMVQNKYFSSVLLDVAEDIRGGKTLS